ncbi:class I SAM-dependent methyltransferase [Chitinophaga horti]|uniref:Class I SAM-dependent methyltransferase n=1 Tax=Chitinophaga horti TaxID=2920382 RepID=A0ABY6J0M9_9BACT|nr:class I SAM-dependent methyltransferase [Chitinophaga horti]UYQ93185.1 class I SAM-dependent methyltransferase [Chitinophaga horti]
MKRAWKMGSRIPLLVDNLFDADSLAHDVSSPKHVSHTEWENYLYKNWNKSGVRILEIGSREVTGFSKARKQFDKAAYVGFDFYAGHNVDVVGDAHKLASYFGEQRFDLIYSSACFEHFAMPWVVAGEIQKLLKMGGAVFVETHFSFRSHERPWNFFQFSDMGLRALFSPAMGFECLDSGMSTPIVARFSSKGPRYLRNVRIDGMYCHSEFLGRKVREVNDFSWQQVDLDEVVEGTRYPEPKNNPGVV